MSQCLGKRQPTGSDEPRERESLMRQKGSDASTMWLGQKLISILYLE
jgi:hypothetical protein